MDNGGTILYKNDKTDTVAAALFHEIVEAIGDQYCNSWWQINDTYMIAAELCDPVQSKLICVKVPDPNNPANKITVGLSDFILPAWCDPQANLE